MHLPPWEFRWVWELPFYYIVYSCSFKHSSSHSLKRVKMNHLSFEGQFAFIHCLVIYMLCFFQLGQAQPLKPFSMQVELWLPLSARSSFSCSLGTFRSYHCHRASLLPGLLLAWDLPVSSHFQKTSILQWRLWDVIAGLYFPLFPGVWNTSGRAQSWSIWSFAVLFGP